VNTDSRHCGGCFIACAAGEMCQAGACTATCLATQKRCGANCVNTNTNTANCGVCGLSCATGQTCVAGVCQ
jgi:hypothetical protein